MSTKITKCPECGSTFIKELNPEVKKINYIYKKIKV
jgi:hypothetical protein